MIHNDLLKYLIHQELHLLEVYRVDVLGPEHLVQRVELQELHSLEDHLDDLKLFLVHLFGATLGIDQHLILLASGISTNQAVDHSPLPVAILHDAIPLNKHITCICPHRTFTAGLEATSGAPHAESTGLSPPPLPLFNQLLYHR